VNGVGKTTSLVKVAAWLRGAGLSVMLAACDTYRTGAIEQLRVHSEVLQVPLYEAGYDQNDTAVARAALAKGTAQGVDVVLVDSAGRMQHAEALMRSLRQLVKEAAPDTVMFVGEAGAGNDIADQVAAFSGRSVRGS
jgi:signal recognition particle receptor subunit alpha